MASVQQRLEKLREERIAREKARIEKLRQFNLNKYNKSEKPIFKTAISNTSVNVNRTLKPEMLNKTQPSKVQNAPIIKNVANNFAKRPRTSNLPVTKGINAVNGDKVDSNVNRHTNVGVNVNKPIANQSLKLKLPTANGNLNKEVKNYVTINKDVKKNVELKHFAHSATTTTKNDHKNANDKVNDRTAARKTMSAIPIVKSTTPNPKSTNKVDIRRTMSSLSHSATKANPNRQSVFERLYQPKPVVKVTTTDAQKLQSDPKYLKKVLKDTGLILNKRQTTFEHRKPLQEKKPLQIRRSISAVHFKRISKNELSNCIHKWSSIGEKINEIDVANIEEPQKHGQITSAVKSERKRVQFQTPSYLNTPTPEELQTRLQRWLQKRGKSIHSYQHLQCFGLHHLPREIQPLSFDNFSNEDENKENVPVDSDSDNGSYDDNINANGGGDLDVFEDCKDDEKWRRRSYISESAGLNETQDSVVTGDTGLSTPAPVENNELLLGALNDITELIREGYDITQAAAWLRRITARWPSAVSAASYWEARAALEDRRGALPAALGCWGRALQAGGDKSVVEASLEPLLAKFMQLNISPRSTMNNKDNSVNNKMVDVKNIFKSTIIRFAVQQAKLRQSTQPETPKHKFICTPVRRSGRLSVHSKPTPVRVCATVKQATEGIDAVFVANDRICPTP